MSRALPTHRRQRRARNRHRAEEDRSHLRLDLRGGELLKEPGEEVARVVNEHIESAESLYGRVDRGLGLGGARNVETDHEQVAMLTERLPNRVRVTCGGHDCVTRC